MKDWQRWKSGAEVCLLVGASAFAGYLISALVSGLFIILPVELISGSASIEREWDGMIYLLMIAVVPWLVDALMRSRAELKKSNDETSDF